MDAIEVINATRYYWLSALNLVLLWGLCRSVRDLWR